MLRTPRNPLIPIAALACAAGGLTALFSPAIIAVLAFFTVFALGAGWTVWRLTRYVSRASSGDPGALPVIADRFHQAFEHTGIGMAIVDRDARWLQANAALCEIFGYTAEELRTRTCHDVTHPEDLAFCPSAMRKLRAGDARFCKVDKRYLRKDGTVVWAQVTLSLVTDDPINPQFVVQVEDISRRRELDENLARARDKALEASRLKSEFLAGMSHEIRTPMNAVIGMGRLLLDTPLNAEQRSMTEVLLQSSEGLMTLLNDILDFSKIEAGRMRVDVAPFDVREILADTFEAYANAARAKGVIFAPPSFENWPTQLLGDRQRIRQVLCNLVGNAVKFTQAGSVRVNGTERMDGGRHWWRIEIIDTGIGIPESGCARLFQTFTQVDGSNTRRYGGTGLGLALSRQLVELMGGRIGCESEVGKGSVFWVELPVPLRDAVAPPGSRVDRPAMKQRMRVLVAEDSEHNQMVMKLMLKKFGCQVDVVTDGIQVLERLAARSYDAVVMDCQMPQLDGYEAARRIRSGEVPRVDPKIPIIAVTAFALDGDRQRCLDAGMSEYVAKPVHEGMLCESFARCGFLLEKRAEDEAAGEA